MKKESEAESLEIIVLGHVNYDKVFSEILIRKIPSLAAKDLCVSSAEKATIFTVPMKNREELHAVLAKIIEEPLLIHKTNTKESLENIIIRHSMEPMIPRDDLLKKISEGEYRIVSKEYAESKIGAIKQVVRLTYKELTDENSRFTLKESEIEITLQDIDIINELPGKLTEITGISQDKISIAAQPNGDDIVIGISLQDIYDSQISTDPNKSAASSQDWQKRIEQEKQDKTQGDNRNPTSK
jgi:hypothetical protein